MPLLEASSFLFVTVLIFLSIGAVDLCKNRGVNIHRDRYVIWVAPGFASVRSIAIRFVVCLGCHPSVSLFLWMHHGMHAGFFLSLCTSCSLPFCHSGRLGFVLQYIIEQVLSESFSKHVV